MGLNLEYINGQTPIDEDEKLGLLIPTISSRDELDEFEQQNIETAMHWLFTRSLSTSEILTEQFIKGLHKKMYDGVWSWAGAFRKSNKNIGVDKWEIPMALKSLLDDTLFWIENETFEPDEIAIRFKHRIVSIHCFSNGNGRHSRLMADIIVEKIYKLPVFTWGTTDLFKQSDARNTYIKAIREADKNNFRLLLSFARS